MALKTIQTMCAGCGHESRFKPVRELTNLVVRGESFEALAEFYRCPKCSEEWTLLGAGLDPLASAYAQYRAKHGLVLPAEITALRNRYDLTQKELAAILGFGDVTLSRYENGALADAAHDKLLRLALEPEGLRMLLRQLSSNALTEARKLVLLTRLAPTNNPSGILAQISSAPSFQGGMISNSIPPVPATGLRRRPEDICLAA